jgi:hypothetical protein
MDHQKVRTGTRLVDTNTIPQEINILAGTIRRDLDPISAQGTGNREGQDDGTDHHHHRFGCPSGQACQSWQLGGFGSMRRAANRL